MSCGAVTRVGRSSRSSATLIDRGHLPAQDLRPQVRLVDVSAGTSPAAAPWTPRELRHSFVSLLPDSGMTVDQIARLVGHASSSSVTELVYRKQIRPVIDEGATAINDLFPGEQQ
nr:MULTISPECIES: tyrosine-type recombinase/integrase [unclassified Pseudonocardia]